MLGINIWIDGGWGVDALLGAQTRPHKDLDIAIEERDVAGLSAALEARAIVK
jgi:lincosamide nucleotidyltransferase A/C/D/E